MRLSKKERETKETALEALEEALKYNALVRRPKKGSKGWAAVEQVMIWWRGEEWPSLSQKQQDDDLRTATAWKTYRAQKGAMSTDVNQALLSEWTATLDSLIKSGRGEVVESPDLPRAPSRPLPSLRPPLQAQGVLSFSGSALEFAAAVSAAGPLSAELGEVRNAALRASRPTKRPRLGRLATGPGPGYQAVLHTPARGVAHVDYISPGGELLCDLVPNLDHLAAEHACSSCSSCEGKLLMPTWLQTRPSGTTSSEAAPDGPAASGHPVAWHPNPGRVVLRHAGHHDQLVPTDASRTEFVLVCGRSSSGSGDFEAASGVNINEQGSSCRCCGTFDETALDDLFEARAEADSENLEDLDMDILRLLGEEEAEKIVLDVTAGTLLGLSARI